MRVTMIRFSAMATLVGSLVTSHAKAEILEEALNLQNQNPTLLQEANDTDTCNEEGQTSLSEATAQPTCTSEIEDLNEVTQELLKFEPGNKIIARPICRS